MEEKIKFLYNALNMSLQISIKTGETQKETTIISMLLVDVKNLFTVHC